ncbi:hypothetical protein JCM9140_3585 [Halalkalibacter wakoensis JCM 9140]|uniref:Fur-regulated basic protein FbpA n=1 Tax=Halalkalibacter wakoensis JCM 9140 TaxID=1236970 RepID=W4Q6Z3_9BACI|nr:Fur-regulated basic protein FbpA [Halalkalibacter wakoensis]GAE27438.1 hypothetical protein JCM9140_3585 [Halalkalibacter wakoensis JCM 9140]
MSHTFFHIDKEQMIDSLLENDMFKMPDGRQFYEASEEELRMLISSQLIANKHDSFSHM